MCVNSASTVWDGVQFTPVTIKGENQYGIKMTEDLVRDKLDEESLKLVHNILNKDREHVDYLKCYILRNNLHTY